LTKKKGIGKARQQLSETHSQYFQCKRTDFPTAHHSAALYYKNKLITNHTSSAQFCEVGQDFSAGGREQNHFAHWIKVKLCTKL
jgi:hypothetical protein